MSEVIIGRKGSIVYMMGRVSAFLKKRSDTKNLGKVSNFQVRFCNSLLTKDISQVLSFGVDRGDGLVSAC